MPTRIETYVKAFGLIGVGSNQRIKSLLRKLESEGRSEKSISFAIWKSQEKLRSYKNDNRFYSVLENEIKKWAWSTHDSRWIEHNKRKQEQEKALKLMEEQDRQKALEKRYKSVYPGFVYFIQGESGGPIKIGFTEDINSRLRTLQTGHFDTLIVLCTYPGKMQQERDYHKQFDQHRLKGEWFKPVQDVLNEVELIKLKPLPDINDFK